MGLRPASRILAGWTLHHSKKESSRGIRQISVPAAPTTPAIITIAATERPPRHLFAAITRAELSKFQSGARETREHLLRLITI